MVVSLGGAGAAAGGVGAVGCAGTVEVAWPWADAHRNAITATAAKAVRQVMRPPAVGRSIGRAARACQRVCFVARMKRSEMRGVSFPDYASLHPGYRSEEHT